MVFIWNCNVTEILNVEGIVVIIVLTLNANEAELLNEDDLIDLVSSDIARYRIACL